MFNTAQNNTKAGGGRYRLSPNEAARVVQEEKERRRKLRLVQVCVEHAPTSGLSRPRLYVDELL